MIDHLPVIEAHLEFIKKQIKYCNSGLSFSEAEFAKADNYNKKYWQSEIDRNTSRIAMFEKDRIAFEAVVNHIKALP